MKAPRLIYLFAGGLTCAALGSASGLRPMLGITWAVILVCLTRLISGGWLVDGGSGRTSQSPPWIFFDSDLPARFFTGESERAREIAAGADWATRPRPTPSESRVGRGRRLVLQPPQTQRGRGKQTYYRSDISRQAGSYEPADHREADQ
jgi:hypothetical protein